MRFLGVDPDRPNATMCDAMALAPADVPREHGTAIVREEQRVSETRAGDHRRQPRLVPAGQVHAGSALQRRDGRGVVRLLTILRPESRDLAEAEVEEQLPVHLGCLVAERGGG